MKRKQTVLTFDKVTESLKVGTFFETRCNGVCLCVCVFLHT